MRNNTLDPVTISVTKTGALDTEVIFNSVEIELIRQWVFREVPTIFADRPVESYSIKMVNAWWQNHHESIAASNVRDRVVWERNPAYPVKALDIPSLIDSLQQIRKLLDLEAIQVLRLIHQTEQSAIAILDLILVYYVLLNSQCANGN